MLKNADKLTTKLAIRYLDSARVLHKNSKSADDFWQPMNHLFAMSAELALKAFLEGRGVSERELKGLNIRHSLNALLSLAVRHGLKTSRDVADALLEMDEAHSSHAYRYVPRPAEAQVIDVYAAHPAVAFEAIQRLLDHCSVDPLELRAQSRFPEDWPYAASPLHPLSTAQLETLVAEKKRRREFFAGYGKRKPKGMGHVTSSGA